MKALPMDGTPLLPLVMDRLMRMERAAQYLRMRQTPGGRHCIRKGHVMSEELRDEDLFVYHKCLRCGEETIHKPKHFYCRCALIPVLEGSDD